MSKKTMVIVAILVVLLGMGAGLFIIKEKNKAPVYKPAQVIANPTTPPNNTPTPGNPRLDNPTEEYKEVISKNQKESGQQIVKINTNGFEPKTITVKVGSLVTWENMDSVSHKPKGTGGGWGSVIDLATGKKYSQQFDTPGEFPYYCELYPEFKGTITVVN